jgi:proliferating cell nuclear antigen PCNA
MENENENRALPQYDSNNLLELRTSECKPFKKIFDTLKENVTDLNIYATENGLKAVSLDVSNTVLIDLELEASNFDHYFCAGLVDQNGDKQPLRLTISVPHVSKVMRTVNSSDDVITWIHRKGSETLDIIFTSKAKNEQRMFNITLQTPEEEVEDMLKIEGIQDYPFVLTMPCVDFQRICKDMKGLGVSEVSITHQGDQLIFASDSEIANCKMIRQGSRLDDAVDTDTNIIFEKLPKEGCVYSDIFKFENLNNFSKCNDIGSKTVRICMNERHPIVFIFKVGTMGEVTFALAPKVPEEEELDMD